MALKKPHKHCTICGLDMAHSDIECPLCQAALSRTYETGKCYKCKKKVRKGITVCKECIDDVLLIKQEV